MEKFSELWYQHFPDTVPLSHALRNAFPDRWIRIHSLPGSKRYPENQVELDSLLWRQNTLITELLGLQHIVYLVSGHFRYAFESGMDKVMPSALDLFSWKNLEPIDLHRHFPDIYERADYYFPRYTTLDWEPSCLDKVLQEIAGGDYTAMLVSFDQDLIIAPYDGGTDLILPDTNGRDRLREKYVDWLSDREDGL